MKRVPEESSSVLSATKNILKKYFHQPIGALKGLPQITTYLNSTQVYN